MADKIKILKIQAETPEKEFAALKKQLEEIKNSSDKVNKAFEDQAKSVVEGTKATNKELGVFQKNLKTVGDNLVTTLKKPVVAFRNFRTELKQQSKELKKSAKEGTLLQSVLSKLAKGLKSVGKVSLKGITTGFKVLGKAVAATGIGALVAAFAILGKAFSKTESGAKLFRKALAAVEAGFAVLTKIIDPVAQQLLSVFEDPKQAIIDFKDLIVENVQNRLVAIGKIGKAVKDIFTAVFDPDVTIGEAFEDLKRIAGEEGIQALTGASKEQQEAFKDLAQEAKTTFDTTFKQAQALSEAETNRAKTLQKLRLELAKLAGEEERIDQLAGANTTNLNERIALDEELIAAREARARKEKEIADFELSLINQQIAFRRANSQDYLDLIDGQTEALIAQQEAESNISNQRLQVELQRKQDFQDNQEQIIDFLRDGIQRQAALRFTQIEDEKTSAARARQILEQFQADSQKSFDRQIEEIQKFTDKRIDANQLLNEQDLDRRKALIDELGLSELINKQLFDTITDRLDLVSDTAEKEAGIRKKETEETEKAYQDRLEAIDEGTKDEALIRAKASLKVQEGEKKTEGELAGIAAEAQKAEIQAIISNLEKKIELSKEYGKDATDLELELVNQKIQLQDFLLAEEAKTEEERLKLLEGANEARKQAIQDTLDFAKEGFEDLQDALNDISDSNIEAATARYDAELVAAEDNAKKIADIEIAKQAELSAIREEATKKRTALELLVQATEQASFIFNAAERIKLIEDEGEKRKEIAAVALEVGKAVSDEIFNLVNERREQEKQGEIEKFDALIKAAEGNEKKQKALEIAKQKFIEQEERKAAKRRKAQAIIDTFIATSLAVVQALPNLILSAIVAGLGLAQVGVIASQKIAEDGYINDGSDEKTIPLYQGNDGVWRVNRPQRKASNGYVVGGRKHAQGGTIIEAERGEPIVKAASYDMVPNVVSWSNQMAGGVRYPNTKKLTPEIAGKLLELNTLPSLGSGGVPMPVQMPVRIPRAQEGILVDGQQVNNIVRLENSQLEYLAGRIAVKVAGVLDDRNLNSADIADAIGDVLEGEVNFV